MTVNPDGPTPISLAHEGDGEDPRLGQRVGRYLLRRLLGRGGTGMVYEATHSDWGQRVAIKILPALGRGDALAQALHEARAVNRVPHPGLARVNDSGLLPDGAAYLVMDLLEGESLFEHLRARGGVLPVQTGLVLLRQAASILAAAHACQVLHLDLKPENLFVCYDPEVPGGLRTKLLDFGLAQVHSVRAAWLRYRRAGTPLYMAPEQWQGQALSAQKSLQFRRLPAAA
mgnify:CR=1 FL=1